MTSLCQPREVDRYILQCVHSVLAGEIDALRPKKSEKDAVFRETQSEIVERERERDVCQLGLKNRFFPPKEKRSFFPSL